MIDKLRSKEDLVYGIVAIIVFWLIAFNFDLFEELLELLEIYEEYELDEFLLLVFITGIVATWYSIRRFLESQKINKKLFDLNKELFSLCDRINFTSHTL